MTRNVVRDLLGISAIFLAVASCVSPEDAGPFRSGITAIYHYPASDHYDVTDGRTAWQIECWGSADDRDACWRRAKWLCNGAYDVLGGDREHIVADPAPVGLFRERLVVACNPDRPPSK